MGRKPRTRRNGPKEVSSSLSGCRGRRRRPLCFFRKGTCQTLHRPWRRLHPSELDRQGAGAGSPRKAGSAAGPPRGQNVKRHATPELWISLAALIGCQHGIATRDHRKYGGHETTPHGGRRPNRGLPRGRAARFERGGSTSGAARLNPFCSGGRREKGGPETRGWSGPFGENTDGT